MTISGSNQSPNCMPSERTHSMRGLSPSGHALVDPPVPQARPVVAAAPEPPVIQDEPLDADPGRPLGEARSFLVVVEVHGLPDVQRDRLNLRMSGQRPLPPCKACAIGSSPSRDATTTTQGMV